MAVCNDIGWNPAFLFAFRVVRRWSTMYQFMVGFKFTQHVCPGRGDHRRRLYQRACPDRMYAPGQGDHWHQKYQSSLFDLCPHCCLPRLIAMMPPLLVLSERCGALNSAALHGIRLHSCPSIWFITHNPFPFFTAHCTLLDTCFGMHFWIPGYAYLPKPCVHVDVPFQITFCSDVLRVASCGNAGLLLHATASMSSGQNLFLQTNIASTMLAGECEPSLLSRYLAARVYFADMCAARPRMSVPVLQWSWSQ